MLCCWHLYLEVGWCTCVPFFLLTSTVCHTHTGPFLHNWLFFCLILLLLLAGFLFLNELFWNHHSSSSGHLVSLIRRTFISKRAMKYNTGDFLDSVIIAIENKRRAQDCVDFRTTSLVSHASKIVLKILIRRLESITESYLGKDQFGFSKDRVTRDAIAANLEYNSSVADTDFSLCLLRWLWKSFWSCRLD